MKRFWQAIVLGLVALHAASAPIALAQVADPPEPMVDAPADAPAENAAKPKTPNKADKPAKATDAPDAGAPDAATPADAAKGVAEKPIGEDHAVRALVESQPKTPVELFRVVYLLVELQRADAAAPFIQQFLAANPSPRDMAAILREHGSGGLMRMMRAEGFSADGRKMVNAVLDGARKHAHDPARLAELVKHLGHRAPEVRRAAMNDLSVAGTDAAVMLVATLADDAAADQHAGVRDALVAMGKVSVDPLIGAVAAAAVDDALAGQAIECLGRIGDRTAVVYLLGPSLSKNAARRDAAKAALSAITGRAPNENDVERLLATEAEAHLARKVRMPADREFRVTLWAWDASGNRMAAKVYHHDDAIVVTAARLAGELVAARAENAAYQRLNTLASLAAAKLTLGIDAPLSDKPGTPLAAAVKRGPAALDEALTERLAKRYIPAAVGVIQALSMVGDASLVTRPAGQPAALVDAVRDADRRIRFAALDALLKIAANHPYVGSSSVVDALAYFAMSNGQRCALIVEPRSQFSQTVASVLGELGYQTDTAMFGRTSRSLLNGSADYDFVLVNLGLEGYDTYDLLSQLRRDPRTAQLPIGIMAPEGQLPRAQRMAAAFERTIAVPQATDKASLEKQAAALVSLQGRLAIAPEVRRRQAELAVAWIAKLSGMRQSVYDLSRCESQIVRALQSSATTASAAETLANLGTHTAQRALVELASQTARPIDMRTTAATAFAKSVPQHGIQLTSDEITRQYERYNASREMNEATQKVLGSILDAIEAPTQAARRNIPKATKASLEH